MTQKELFRLLDDIYLHKSENLKTTYIPDGMFEETSDLKKDWNFDSLDMAEFAIKVENSTGISIFKYGVITQIGEIKKRLNIKE